MTGDDRIVFALVSDHPDRDSEMTLDSCAACMAAGQWIVGVTRRPDGPFWVDRILLGEDRFLIRPRIRVSPGRTAWFNLDGWAGSPYERRWPVPVLNPAAFTEHALTRPDDWLRDTARQDMRRILGGA